MEGNFLCVPTDVWNAEIIYDCIFPLSAPVSGPQTWADKQRLGSYCKALFYCDIQRNRLSVYICDCNSFSSSWFLTLSPRGGLTETPEPPQLRVSFALSVWWILWIQTLTKPDDLSLLMSWILRGVTPPTAAPKPAAQKLTRCSTWC